jgi:hypothetical protein
LRKGAEGRRAVSRGGSFGADNLVFCCDRCNQAKGILSAEEFAQLLAIISSFHPRAKADLLARLRAGGKMRRNA